MTQSNKELIDLQDEKDFYKQIYCSVIGALILKSDRDKFDPFDYTNEKKKSDNGNLCHEAAVIAAAAIGLFRDLKKMSDNDLYGFPY